MRRTGDFQPLLLYLAFLGCGAEAVMGMLLGEIVNSFALSSGEVSSVLCAQHCGWFPGACEVMPSGENYRNVRRPPSGCECWPSPMSSSAVVSARWPRLDQDRRRPLLKILFRSSKPVRASPILLRVYVLQDMLSRRLYDP